MDTRSKRSFRLFAARGCLTLAAVVAIAGLTGCGGSASPGAAASESNAVAEQRAETQDKDPFQGVSPADVPDTLSGIRELSDAVKSFKIAVESGGKEEAATLADSMASLWLAIAEETKAKQPERHAQLQGDLSKLLTAAKAEEWDTTLLIDLDYSLYQGLRDLKQALEGETQQ